MATCLVTGGAGFIGSHIVDALLARGNQVKVLDNLSTGRLENLTHIRDKIEFIAGDLRDEAAVRQAVAGVEAIFHLAALVSVPESVQRPLEAEQVNAIGTLHLLQAAQAVGVRRLVFSSTCAVYGDEPTLPKTERMPPAPQSPYAISKLAAEGYCKFFTGVHGLETVILRYFNVYGPRQDPSSAYSGVISIFVNKLSQGTAPLIYGDGEQSRDFVFVADVTRANLIASTHPTAAGHIFNIGTGRPATINRLFKALCTIFNCNVQPTYRPARPGDIRHSYADPGAALAGLGWSAQVPLEEGLRRLVANTP
jgi:UDP-glucose 4-epimerase